MTRLDVDGLVFLGCACMAAFLLGMQYGTQWGVAGGTKAAGSNREWRSDMPSVERLEATRPRGALGAVPAAPLHLRCLRTDLRWMIEHRTESGFNWHYCANGEVWQAVVNEWRTM